MAAAAQDVVRAREVRANDRSSSAWARYLIPSLSEVLLFAIIGCYFISNGGWMQLLGDGDTGWHIRTGQYILKSGGVPYTDPFSFTKPGQPWFAWEWLTDVLYAGLFAAAGLKAIVLFTGLVIAGSMVLLFRRMLAENVNAFAALILTMMATAGASVHYWARPHTITFLLVAVVMWLLAADRKNPSWRVWLLAPLTVLWVNMHGGWAALIVTLAVAVAGSAAEAWLNGGDWKATRRYAKLLAACSGASLLNPFFLNLHLHVLEYMNADWIRSSVHEAQSPSFRTENMLHFEVLLLAGLITAAFLLRRRKIVEGLWILLFAHMTLESARHIPLFLLAVTPYVGAEISAWWRDRVAAARSGSAFQIFDSIARDLGAGAARTSVFVVLIPVLLALTDERLIKWPADFPADTFPTRAVAAHQSLLAGHKVLTTDQWADYLIYKLYPNHKVFFDGRSDFYGPEIGKDYLALSDANWKWRELMDRYGFDYVLAPVKWPLAAVLKEAKWVVVEDDGQAIVLARPASDGVENEVAALMKRTPTAEGTGRDHHE